MTETTVDIESKVPIWQPILFGAMAGGLAWGVRGQYGHETGAMMAGLLVGFTMVFLFCRNASAISTARAVAFMTVAIGIGGNMTYGQTVGLTHDGPLIGHNGAYWWGMLGLGIKGAAWIGFGALFLGIGLGGVKYKPLEMLALMLGCVVAYFVGVRLLNHPFNPAEKELPFLYFSDDWRWEPDGDVKPRRESWGGLWLALVIVIGYVWFRRKDLLARNMAFFGILGGALGFPIGQSIQAHNAWNPGFLSETFAVNIFPSTEWWTKINWWNMMETTFGMIMGGVIGLGLWLNRKRINPLPAEQAESIHPSWGILALAIHLPMLAAVEFKAYDFVDMIYDVGLFMAIIPIVALTAGRVWPYLVVFPILLMPIAGKTVRQLVVRADTVPPYFGMEIGTAAGWFVYFVLPMGISLGLAVWFLSKPDSIDKSRLLAKVGLLFSVWVIFYLNWAFFDFPWPWQEWTGRTLNGIIFFVCAAGLTLLALTKGFGMLDNSEEDRDRQLAEDHS